MSMPPLAAFSRAMPNANHVELLEARTLALPRSGAPATLVRFTGWHHYVDADIDGRVKKWKDRDKVTAVHRWCPELIGRCTGWSFRLREVPERGIRPVADMADKRDQPFIQAVADRGIGEPMLRGPLRERVTPASDRMRGVWEHQALGLDYRCGHLVARVHSHEQGDAEIAQLVDMLETAHPLLAELAPPAAAVDAHHGPDKPREIPPGAESFEHAKELMAGPKRFLRGRETPGDDAVLSGFAASYAAARRFRSEFAPHADVELGRYGAPARAACSVIAALPDGRPARLAQARGWSQLGEETRPGRRRIVESAHDVAITAVSEHEASRLAAHLPRSDAWLAGPYLTVVAPAEWRRPTAAGLDAVLASAGELVRWAGSS